MPYWSIAMAANYSNYYCKCLILYLLAVSNFYCSQSNYSRSAIYCSFYISLYSITMPYLLFLTLILAYNSYISLFLLLICSCKLNIYIFLTLRLPYILPFIANLKLCSWSLLFLAYSRRLAIMCYCCSVIYWYIVHFYL